MNNNDNLSFTPLINDLSEYMTDLSGDMIDASGEALDISGEDVSGDYLTNAILSRSITSSFVNRLIDTIDNNIEAAVSREVSILEKPVYKTVITEECEGKLKKVKFKDSEKKNESCPILFIDFDEEEEIIELECKHCFNEVAIKKWLKEEKAECPVCRYTYSDTRKKKIVMPEISRDEIRNDITESYLNYMDGRMNESYDRINDIEIQRMLLEQYE